MHILKFLTTAANFPTQEHRSELDTRRKLKYTSMANMFSIAEYFRSLMSFVTSRLSCFKGDFTLISFFILLHFDALINDFKIFN